MVEKAIASHSLSRVCGSLQIVCFFFHLFFCLFCRIFILSLVFFFLLFLFCSLPQWGCQLHANSSRWHSIVQIRPGVVCLCLRSVMQCAKMRLTETLTVSSKELSCCVAYHMVYVCADDLSVHVPDQYMDLSSRTSYRTGRCVWSPVVIHSCVSG